MSSSERIDNFLDQATAGLASDAELQLDVRTELLSHLETAMDSAVGSGMSEPEALDSALASVGPVTDISGDLVAGNRRRLRTWARVRNALRFALVPAAIVFALFTIGFPAGQATREVAALGGGSHPASAFVSLLPSVLVRSPKLTPEQELLLHGDAARSTTAERERAIWEAAPDNAVYFGNYLTHLLAETDRPDASPDAISAFIDACRQGMAMEPDNARYHYLIGGILLKQACEVQSVKIGEHTDDRPRYDYILTINDRARLDEAMAEFRRGAAKPHYRRYGHDMVRERLAVWGQPKSMLAQVRAIHLSCSILLPDLSLYRNGIRAASAYAEVLARQGRNAEAAGVLSWWEPYALHLAEDSFCLIDLLVIKALLSTVEDQYAPVYRDLGDDERADTVAARAAALAAPMTRWDADRKRFNGSREDAEFGQLLRESGSVLIALLLPALGHGVDAAELAPGRWLEYVMAESAVRSLTSLALIAAIAMAAATAARWRFAKNGRAIPILLVPDWTELARALGFGILCPLLAFYGLTRWLPFGGRAFSLHYCWPRFALQAGVLLCVMSSVTTGLMVRSCTRRCRELGVACPLPSWPNRWEIVTGVGIALGLAAAAWLIATQAQFREGCAVVLIMLIFLGYIVLCKATDPRWQRAKPRQRRPRLFAAVCGAFLLVSFLPSEWLRTYLLLLLAPAALWLFLALVVWPLANVTRFVTGNREYGLYYGSVARSLIPGLALALVVLNLIAFPCLTHSESSLVASDRLLCADGDGFTKVEADLVRGMRAEMLQATRAQEVEQSAR